MMESKSTVIFEKQKAQCLSAVDLSRKGSIDAPIWDLVAAINAQDAYFTTSSCSGRVCVFEENADAGVRKQGCKWLYTTHGECQLAEVGAAVDQSSGDASFKFEPFVMHVQCRTLQHAQALHAAAVGSGFRNSGISVGKKGKIIMAVRSTHSMEAPVTAKGQALVDHKYLRHLCCLANKKMETNKQLINRFHENFMRCLESIEVHPKDKQEKKATKKAISQLNGYEVKNDNLSVSKSNISDKYDNEDYSGLAEFYGDET